MTPPSEDYYKTLQVDPSAEEEVIKAAYNRLSKKYHPDGTNPDPEKMVKLNLAYEVLGNKAKRTEYDADRKRYKASPASPPFRPSRPSPPPPPKVYNPVIRVVALSVNPRVIEAEEDEPISAEFRVEHVSGELPPKWAWKILHGGSLLADAEFEVVPRDGFPATIYVEIPPQKAGSYADNFEIWIE